MPQYAGPQWGTIGAQEAGTGVRGGLGQSLHRVSAGKEGQATKTVEDWLAGVILGAFGAVTGAVHIGRG